MTVREAISEVRNDLRAVGIDVWIPGKYIHSKLISKAILFIKRESDDKRIFRYTNLWTPVCLDMIEDDIINCCNIPIPGCTKVMRSKNKIPEIYTTRFGYLGNTVTDDFGKDYTPTTPQQYKYTKSREFKDRSKRYCWIANDYLIIPDSMVSNVTLSAMFINKADALKIDCRYTDSCIKVIDEDFVAPAHLWDDIKKATVIDIAQIYEKIQPDELTNLNSLEKTNPAKL